MRPLIPRGGFGSTANRRSLLGVLAGLAVPAAAAAKSKTKPTTKRKRPKPCVGPFSDVTELQDLVDHAKAKRTVRLCAGTFTNTGVTINKTLTIVGAGKDQTVLQGRWPAPGPAVTVAAGAKVTLKNLAVATNYNGAADAASHGGGILNQGTLTLTGCAVNGHYAHDGGGLYNAENATLTLNDTEVFDNSSAANLGKGGGIFNNRGTLTLNDSVVTGNAGYDGGGIGTVLGTTVLDGTKVTGNQGFYGGGIESWGSGGRLEVRNGSVIGGNGAAGNSAYTGGGLYNENATAIFEQGTQVIGNSLLTTDGRRAGGILNDSGNVSLPDTTIVTGNLPTNCGGPDGGAGDPIANCVDACLPYGGFCKASSACCDDVPCTAGRCRLP